MDVTWTVQNFRYNMNSHTCASRAQLQKHADHGYICCVEDLGPVPQHHGPQLWGGRQQIHPALLAAPSAPGIHPAAKGLPNPLLSAHRAVVDSGIRQGEVAKQQS